MVLIVFFSSRISPLTSTVILRLRSPRATAVVTSAMLRTCAVRLLPMVLTESVRSFHVPAAPGTTACTPSRPSVPDLACYAGDLGEEGAKLLDHRVDCFFEL